MLAGTRRKMLHGAATGQWGGRDASDTLAAEVMGNHTLRSELFPALVRAYASLDQVEVRCPSLQHRREGHTRALEKDARGAGRRAPKDSVRGVCNAT